MFSSERGHIIADDVEEPVVLTVSALHKTKTHLAIGCGNVSDSHVGTRVDRLDHPQVGDP